MAPADRNGIRNRCKKQYESRENRIVNAAIVHPAFRCTDVTNKAGIRIKCVTDHPVSALRWQEVSPEELYRQKTKQNKKPLTEDSLTEQPNEACT